MAHTEQLEFVESVRAGFPDFFKNKRVLEIGSLDINGGVRSLFSDCEYIGIDVASGPGVDIVCQGQDYDAPDSSFDSVICCEVMEHNPHWQETFTNMFRLCRPGGLVVMTCAAPGRPEHGTTRTTPEDSPLSVGIGWDYYRNLTARDFRRGVDLSRHASVYKFFQNTKSYDLYFVGFRYGADAPPMAPLYLAMLQRRYIKECVRTGVERLKQRVLIALVGEERYWRGPVRFWSK